MKKEYMPLGPIGRDILILGIARNCEKQISKDINALLNAARGCNRLSWLIVESDSTDKTVETLSELREKIPNFRFISLGSLSERIPIRTQRTAHCRNACLAELESNPLYAKVEYVIVADLDGMNGLLTPSGLASCWDRTDWDVCAANQRGPYYDVWTLRHKMWCPNDCWEEVQFLKTLGVEHRAAHRKAIYSKMIVIAEDSEWIEVDSAFGGLAVYRRTALTNAKYRGLSETGVEVCEHVPLNSQIRANGGRIFINPRLINTDYNEHTRVLRLASRIRGYCYRGLQRVKRILIQSVPVRN